MNMRELITQFPTSMTNKKSMASKMESKSYTSTRCGHCGKFGHHHSEHIKAFNQAEQDKARFHTSINSPIKFPKKEIKKRFNQAEQSKSRYRTITDRPE